MATDRQGSVTAVTNDAGSVLGIDTYDESGTPGAGNIGRFQYDGVPYLPEADLYHMRARDYSYRLGRFIQTDPSGHTDSLNGYNYALSDPVNGLDPTGLDQCTGSLIEQSSCGGTIGASLPTQMSTRLGEHLVETMIINS